MKKFLFPKIFVVFLTLFGFSRGVSAQDEAFNKGDMIINVGVGLGTYISDKGLSMTVPPISASFEYSVVDLFDGRGGIGFGGYACYLLRKSSDLNMNVGDFIIGPRGLFHYQFVDHLDTYAGFLIGYDVVSFNKSENLNLSGSGFSPAFFVGARYYFTDHIAVWGELGYGVSPLQLGLAYKF